MSGEVDVPFLPESLFLKESRGTRGCSLRPSGGLSLIPRLLLLLAVLWQVKDLGQLAGCVAEHKVRRRKMLRGLSRQISHIKLTRA